MTTKTGVWNLQQVRDKQLQSLWSYAGLGELWVWGYQSNTGALGQNSHLNYSSPTQIPGSWADAKILRKSGDGDYNHTTVIKSDGTLWSWGRNENGQLGQNSTTYYSSPVQVGSDTTWSTGSGIRKATAAIKTDGTLWSWGYANWGMMAQNNVNVKYSSPVQIPGTTWAQVSGGHLNVFGVKTDGTLWAWGNNHEGKLGLNQNQNDSGFSKSSPVQIPGTTWAVASGQYNAGFAAKTDGTLWAWGYNANGELGQGNTTKYSSPVQVPGTTWGTTQLTFMQGVEQMGSIKTDGTLWMWGKNERGNLGQNNLTNYSSPRQVPGTTWRSAVFLGATGCTTLATKTDGTLWAWGDNNDGRCAQNNDPDNGGVNAYSSPVQIPGTAWTEMMGAAGSGLAVIKGES